MDQVSQPPPSQPQPKASPPVQSGSAVPPSTGEIHVVPQPIEPHDPPKPGSAKARAFDKLRSMASTDEQPEAPAAKPPAGKKVAAKTENKAPAAVEPGPGEDPDVSPSSGVESPSPTPGEEPEPGQTPAGKESAGKKPSPWKLLDEAKERLARTEKELSDTRSKILPDADRKVFEERVQKAETRVKELEDQIRFVDYSKSAEFQEKYQVPYTKAWDRAMSELREISVDDGDGGRRAVTPADLLELVNMPLGRAREVADQVFGHFADDVMAHRKEIRGLFEAQTQALEDARKNGAEREKQQSEQVNAKRAEIQKTVSQMWAAENEAVVKHEKYGKFFAQREGDDLWNGSLAKGFEMVDKAMAESPLNPDLTPEQRQMIVKRHAAVRNRAAAWGAMRAENDRLSSKIAALEKEIAQYKDGEPGLSGDVQPGATPAPPASAMERARQNLRKFAH